MIIGAVLEGNSLATHFTREQLVFYLHHGVTSQVCCGEETLPARCTFLILLTNMDCGDVVNARRMDCTLDLLTHHVASVRARTVEIYRSRRFLPLTILNEMNPIYVELMENRSPGHLTKRLHGHTQNSNECFNDTKETAPKMRFSGSWCWKRPYMIHLFIQ